MTLPKNFNLKINLKRAISNAAGIVLFLVMVQITTPWILVTGAIFGLFGGSIMDIVSWRGNRAAIDAQSEKNPDEGEN